MRIRQLFNLYPGEEKRALAFALLAVVWAAAGYLGVLLSESLLLLRIGSESLAWTYIFTGGLMMGWALILLKGVESASATSLFSGASLLATCFYLTTFFTVQWNLFQDNYWFWVLFKSASYIVWMQLTMSFWAFVDQYHDLQDSKRLFVLFSSGIFVGTMIAGAVLSIQLFNTQSLLLGISIACLLLAGGIVYLGRSLSPVYDDTVDEWRASSPTPLPVLIKKVLHSRFTLTLLISYLILHIVMVLADFYVLNTFDENFVPEKGFTGDAAEAPLTTALGQVAAVISLATLIFGLFAYSRIVKKIGIHNMIPVLPLCYFVLFALWPYYPGTMALAIMGYAIIEGLLYIVDDNTYNLCLNAVPSKIKNKIRVVTESFFEPFGMLIAGFLLLGAHKFGAQIAFGLTCGALVLVWRLRRTYHPTLMQQLSEHHIPFYRQIAEWDALYPEKRLTENLLKYTDQLDGLNALLDLEPYYHLPQILKAVQSLPTPQKIAFVRNLQGRPLSNDPEVIEALQEWLSQRCPEKLESAITFHLASEGLIDPNQIEPNTLEMRGAWILALSFSLAKQTVQEGAENRKVAAEQIQQLLGSHVPKEISMGLKILSLDPAYGNIELVLPFLSHHCAEVIVAAAKAIKVIIDPEDLIHQPLLLEHLKTAKNHQVRTNLIRAIAKTEDTEGVAGLILASEHWTPRERRICERAIRKQGLHTVPILLRLTQQTALPPPCRLLAGRVLGHLAPAQLQANLEPIVSTEIEQAYFYFYYLNTLQARYPDRDLKLFLEALESSLTGSVITIVHLLGSAASVEEGEVLSYSLSSRNEKVYSHALELLEICCSRALFQKLEPLVDQDLPLEERIRRCQPEQELTLSELLEKMSRSERLQDQMAAFWLMATGQEKGWRKRLRDRMRHTPSEIFQHFGYELLES